MAYSPELSTQTTLRQQSILTQVYAWMTAGLLVTGAIATFVANSPALEQLIFSNQWVYLALIICELAFVLGIGASINRLSPAVATGLFLAYAVLNGLTLSVIFL